jgi:hypothetical protein
VAFVVAGLVLTGSTAAGGVRRPVLRVLQLNLCNSGLAGCYTGRAVGEATALIRETAPDVVTLNEICRADVSGLYQSLDGYAWAFQAAGDRPTGGSTLCRNGQPYGIGLLVRTSLAYGGFQSYGGLYPAQDLGDTEERAWLCIQAEGAFYACTTHLAAASSTVALAQCGYLMDAAIPQMQTSHGYAPTVVGGDFNLRPGDVRSCAPPAYSREDDHGVQQVLATTEFTVSSTRQIDMHATTDHPGLLVSLTLSTVD